MSVARGARGNVAVVGAGPAGLFAAETIAQSGLHVTIYEAMASPARKFLLAGRGGLNLTHSEPLEEFLKRYGDDAQRLVAAVRSFPPRRLIDWANGLGADTFVGTSGRVFPRAMKASPLLRAWLKRLAELGIEIKTRHRLIGFDGKSGLTFETASGVVNVSADATLLALGGGSWPRLGSDAAWVNIFNAAGIAVTRLAPANCGIIISWSDVFRSRFEGRALKRVAMTIGGCTKRGEAIVTRHGLQGGVVYAFVPKIRAALEARGDVEISLDLKPDASPADVAKCLEKARHGDTVTNTLRKALNLDDAAIGLLREAPLPEGADALAARIKSVPLRVTGVEGLARAISTAGGISSSALDDYFMVKDHPGLFVAGEMLDWEAPTGGYLLQGTFATAFQSANGLIRWVAAHRPP